MGKNVFKSNIKGNSQSVGQVLPDNETKCHSKLDLESHRTSLRNNEILNQVQDDRRKGFTLIELLVVVLIIAILAAIALPQYQKAVLKSRYSGLMPIARAVANGQELYYMEKGNYASDITKLDIKVPSGGANANIEVSDGSDERFEYVLATKDNLSGLAYVIYQKHSPQFADTVMCEANDELNSKATWLCKDALKGEEVASGSLLGTGWTAYIIQGTEGTSTFEKPSSCAGNAPTITAGQSGATSTAECVDGEWKFVTWENGITYSGDVCDGDYEYDCAGATFENAECNGYVESSCSNATFKEGSSCYGNEPFACANSIFETSICNGYAESSCSNSTYDNGSRCMGSCENSTFVGGSVCSDSCGGATFSDGAMCNGDCTDAIIQDGGICRGDGCASATYSGTGCCAGRRWDDSKNCGNAPVCTNFWM